MPVQESGEGSQVLGDLFQVKGEKKALVALGREREEVGGKSAF